MATIFLRTWNSIDGNGIWATSSNAINDNTLTATDGIDDTIATFMDLTDWQGGSLLPGKAITIINNIKITVRGFKDTGDGAPFRATVQPHTTATTGTEKRAELNETTQTTLTFDDTPAGWGLSSDDAYDIATTASEAVGRIEIGAWNQSGAFATANIEYVEMEIEYEVTRRLFIT